MASDKLIIDDSVAGAYPEIAPADYVVLTAQDTGAGIPDEIKPHIFEPFFTTKSVGEGTVLEPFFTRQ